MRFPDLGAGKRITCCSSLAPYLLRKLSSEAKDLKAVTTDSTAPLLKALSLTVQ